MGIFTLRTVATVVDRLGDNKRERRVLLRDLETTAPAKKIATGKKTREKRVFQADIYADRARGASSISDSHSSLTQYAWANHTKTR